MSDIPPLPKIAQYTSWTILLRLTATIFNNPANKQKNASFEALS